MKSKGKDESELYLWISQGVDAWLALKENDPTGDAFSKVKILEISATTVKVENQKDKKTSLVKKDQLFQMNKESYENVNDLTDIENLNEAEMIVNLQRRFEKNKIFSYVGPTLIALNPFQLISELFSEQSLKHYQDNIIEDIKNLNPHIYSISGNCFKQYLMNKRNQAIVISGESGAGKTEETKLAMKFLTSISSSKNFEYLKYSLSENSRRRSSINAIAINQDQGIEDKILSCNPILEAFGNAKTIRNDNSSRFGKLVLLLVDNSTDKINGALITTYLLEKSRVVQSAKDERNYHVFYFFLKSLSEEEKEKYKFKDLKSYNYLKNSTTEVATIDDRKCYEEIQESFKTMNFKEEEISALYRIMSAILKLGNIDFDESTLDNNNPCSIMNEAEVNDFIELLDLDGEALKQELLFKTIEIGGQKIHSSINKENCNIIKDSLAKDLYEKLFLWLVKKLNNEIATETFKNVPIEVILKDSNRNSIGLLDIFGFEVFKINSFEQICINFANEKLQQLYINYAFKNEIKAFTDDGLDNVMEHITFTDNQPVIDLFELPPNGIFPSLDDDCTVTSSDDGYLQKVTKNNRTNKCMKIPKIAKGTFIVVHSAKEVEYSVTNFRAKNKDELPSDLSNVITNSKNQMISLVNQGALSMDELDYLKELEEDQDTRPKAASKKSSKFLGSKFRLQMKSLMDELNSCDCHFVRCIKPNDVKKKLIFMPQLVLNQVRYLGVLDAITVRKESFPIRRNYDQFISAYYELSDKANSMSYLDYKEKEEPNREFAQEFHFL